MPNLLENMQEGSLWITPKTAITGTAYNQDSGKIQIGGVDPSYWETKQGMHTARQLQKAYNNPRMGDNTRQKLVMNTLKAIPGLNQGLLQAPSLAGTTGVAGKFRPVGAGGPSDHNLFNSSWTLDAFSKLAAQVGSAVTDRNIATAHSRADAAKEFYDGHAVTEGYSPSQQRIADMHAADAHNREHKGDKDFVPVLIRRDGTYKDFLGQQRGRPTNETSYHDNREKFFNRVFPHDESFDWNSIPPHDRET
tara:strand:+ start:6772 stop:7521 length:750 start_codon:yes stop_codon:yes gene_type:complete